MFNKIKQRFNSLKQNKTKGFTLIELVVVMAIITILTGIFVPNFIEYSNRFNSERIQDKMLQIHTSIEITHEKGETLQLDRIIKYSKVPNIRIQETTIPGFFTIYREPIENKVVISYMERRGLVHRFDETAWDEYTQDIEENIDYSKYIITYGNEVQGLTESGVSFFSGKLVIPEKINGITITSIRDYAFEYKNLSSVELPETITHIGDGAFRYNNLSTLRLPEKVREIGDDAFYGNNLSSITLSKELYYIGARSFMNNNLKNIIIPNSVFEIKESAFKGNDLLSVILPTGIMSLGNEAFSKDSGWKTISDSNSGGNWGGAWVFPTNGYIDTLWEKVD